MRIASASSLCRRALTARVCTSGRCGLPRCASRKDFVIAPGCMWNCGATGEECSVATGLMSDEKYREHLVGCDHPERPERFAAVMAALGRVGLIEKTTRVPS